MELRDQVKGSHKKLFTHINLSSHMHGSIGLGHDLPVTLHFYSQGHNIVGTDYGQCITTRIDWLTDRGPLPSG